MSRFKIAAIILLAAAAAVAAIAGSGLLSVTATAQENNPALEDFIPSEELPSDSAVAFPVDI